MMKKLTEKERTNVFEEAVRIVMDLISIILKTLADIRKFR